MADERVPFRWGKWYRTQANPVSRGAEHGTLAPLARGIRSRLKSMKGPSEEELQQWQQQVQRMQEAGFAWDEQKKQWRRGELYVDPWAFPEHYPEKKG